MPDQDHQKFKWECKSCSFRRRHGLGKWHILKYFDPNDALRERVLFGYFQEPRKKVISSSHDFYSL